MLMLLISLILDSFSANAFDVGGNLPSIDPRYDTAIRSATQATAITIGLSRDLDLVQNYVNSINDKQTKILTNLVYKQFGQKNVEVVGGLAYIAYKQDVRKTLPFKVLDAETTLHANLNSVDCNWTWRMK